MFFALLTKYGKTMASTKLNFRLCLQTHFLFFFVINFCLQLAPYCTKKVRLNIRFNFEEDVMECLNTYFVIVLNCRQFRHIYQNKEENQKNC